MQAESLGALSLPSGAEQLPQTLPLGLELFLSFVGVIMLDRAASVSLRHGCYDDLALLKQQGSSGTVPLW